MKHFALLPHNLILSLLLRTSVLVSVLLLGAPSAQAGCGCDKPPPAPASVRPNVTYGDTSVTLFGFGITAGQLYDITFTAMDSTSVTVSSVQAISKRDLADAVYKAQLVVTVPRSLPLGPVGITVKQAGQPAVLLSVPDTSFTLAPAPVAVPSQPGKYSYQSVTAAVGRDGTVYLTLDLTGVTMPRTIRAQAKGYALRFTKDNAIFYNTQGFLMQLVGAPIVGLATIDPGNNADSDILQYARHEFATFYMQHAERQSHNIDPADGNWHTDGTRHVDHDKLILALAGATVNGATPAAGSTPPFILELHSYSFFQNGLVGTDWMTMNSLSGTDSYNSRTGLILPLVGTVPLNSQGDILSNGTVTLGDLVAIKGNATGKTFALSKTALVTGQKNAATKKAEFIPVAVPKDLPDLGKLNLGVGLPLILTRTLGPGSYKASQLNIGAGGMLTINNTAGPVTLYVTGPVQVTGGFITVTDPNPEKFAIYVAGANPLRLQLAGRFYGVVYAPQSELTLWGLSEFFGAFVGQGLNTGVGAKVHYDTALRGQ
jgi:hypothetical protein